jgi:hypothetical protein
MPPAQVSEKRRRRIKTYSQYIFAAQRCGSGHASGSTFPVEVGERKGGLTKAKTCCDCSSKQAKRKMEFQEPGDHSVDS